MVVVVVWWWWWWTWWWLRRPLWRWLSRGNGVVVALSRVLPGCAHMVPLRCGARRNTATNDQPRLAKLVLELVASVWFPKPVEPYPRLNRAETRCVALVRTVCVYSEAPYPRFRAI